MRRATTTATIESLADVLLPDTLTIALGDPTGFLNGRRLADDVINAEFSLLTNGNVTSDGVDANDKAFLANFPYEAAPSLSGHPAGSDASVLDPARLLPRELHSDDRIDRRPSDAPIGSPRRPRARRSSFAGGEPDRGSHRRQTGPHARAIADDQADIVTARSRSTCPPAATDLDRIRANVAFWSERARANPRDFVSSTRWAASEIDLARATSDVTRYVAADEALDVALAANPDYRPGRELPRRSARRPPPVRGGGHGRAFRPGRRPGRPGGTRHARRRRARARRHGRGPRCVPAAVAGRGLGGRSRAAQPPRLHRR